MAKTIPTTYADTAPSSYATGEIVFASDWRAIVEGQHFHHSRTAGFHSIGKAFDPVATTTSATYNQTSGLDELMWTSQFHRLTNASGNLRYRIWLVIIGEQIDVRMSVRDPGGMSTTLTASKSGTGFARAVAADTTFTSGSGPKLYELEFRQNTGGTGTGSLAHVLVAEEPYTNTEYLPTGR